MGKIRFFSVVMAIAMLMPVLTSCKSGKIGKNVVKADDPWYESTRFELSQDLGQNDSVGASYELCASNDKVFYLYCFSKTFWATSTTVIDSYDFDGNMVNRSYVSYPDEVTITDIEAVHADPEGKTISAVVEYYSDTSYGPAFIDIDTETGKASNMKEIINYKTKPIIKYK